MVLSGSVEHRLFGTLHRDATPVDLCACLLYPASFALIFNVLKGLIFQAVIMWRVNVANGWRYASLLWLVMPMTSDI